MHLSGQLTDWSINDLLQIMQVTNKTGSLDIDGERRGRIHFRDGVVTGAELTGDKGSMSGDDRGGVADILYVLSSMGGGTFKVGPADGPEDGGWSVEDVLSDLEALRSLEGEVIDAGLFEAPGVRFVQEIPEPITISPEDWAIVVSLIEPFTFGHLESVMGRGGAVRVFHTLHRLAIAEAVSEDDGESEWLDRLADDIAPDSSEPTWREQPDVDEIVVTPANAQPEVEPIPEPAPIAASEEDDHANDMRGVSAPASTTLTDGVYDEIRRLRSKVTEQ